MLYKACVLHNKHSHLYILYSTIYSVINQYCLNRCLYYKSTVVALNQCTVHTHTHSPPHTYILVHPGVLSFVSFIFFANFAVCRPSATTLFFGIDFTSKSANHSHFIGLGRGWNSALTYFAVLHNLSVLRRFAGCTLDRMTIHLSHSFFAATVAVARFFGLLTLFSLCTFFVFNPARFFWSFNPI